ncbi:MAG: hypothetical protein M3159_02085 [Actinomycetota bacterium]|nr:hypothetical protein [Actinomycetota bacterium]
MAATLEDLARRVTAMAERSATSRNDSVGRGGSRAVSVSQELFEVERSLGEAIRRLGALSRAVNQAAL